MACADDSIADRVKERKAKLIETKKKEEKSKEKKEYMNLGIGVKEFTKEGKPINDKDE